MSTYQIPSLDDRPPVQEDLDGLEMTILSSTAEGGRLILAEIQRHMTDKYDRIKIILLHTISKYTHTY